MSSIDKPRHGGHRVGLERQVRHVVLRIGSVHARDVDQVGDHRRSGRLGTCARAVVQRRADRVALDEHRVHRAFDAGDQALHRHQRRMHAQLDAARRALGDAEQLDAVAELLGVADVGRRQSRDAFGVRRVEVDRHAEGDRRQQRQLVGGVDAFDVEGRIGLGVAQALRFGQHRVEGSRRARASRTG